MFYCERHTPGSGFYASTSVGFTCEQLDRCGICWGNGQSCCTCNDGDVCTVDSCDPSSTDQKCIATPIPCDDKNACTEDTCDRVKGCQYRNTTSECTKSDKCYDYGCATDSGCFSRKKPCESDLCTTRTCDPNTGICRGESACPEIACYDLVGCTLSGGCQYNPRSCVPDAKCQTSVCDVTTDLCKVTDLTPAECNGCDSTTCVPGNKCEIAFCNATGLCQKQQKCIAPSACSQPLCDDATGQCSTAPTCTTNDTVCFPRKCSSSTGLAVCADPTNPCDDNNACTIDSCSTGSDNQPVCTNVKIESPDVCIVYDCVNGTIVQSPLVCATDDKCQTGSCVSGVGCVFTNITVPDYDNKCILTECDSQLGIINTTYPCYPSDRCSCTPKDGCQCSGLSIGAIAGISAGAAAGAAIGAAAGAAILGFAGKKGFDFYAASQAASGNVNNNPLYESNIDTHTNPLAD